MHIFTADINLTGLTARTERCLSRYKSRQGFSAVDAADAASTSGVNPKRAAYSAFQVALLCTTILQKRASDVESSTRRTLPNNASWAN